MQQLQCTYVHTLGPLLAGVPRVPWNLSIFGMSPGTRLYHKILVELVIGIHKIIVKEPML